MMVKVMMKELILTLTENANQDNEYHLDNQLKSMNEL
jgi:hypothetical protein